MAPDRRVLVRRGAALIVTAALLLLLSHAPPLATLRGRWIPQATAEASSRVLSIVALPNYRSGNAIYGQGFTLLVSEEEALYFLYPLALALALCWPGSPVRRGLTVLLSAPAVLLVAVLRIVNIFIVGSSSRPRAVAFHDYVWPAVLLVLGGFLWLRWCHAAQGSTPGRQDASSPSGPSSGGSLPSP